MSSAVATANELAGIYLNSFSGSWCVEENRVQSHAIRTPREMVATKRLHYRANQLFKIEKE